MSSESYCSEGRFGEWCGDNVKIDAKKLEMKKAIFKDANADYSKPFAYCMNINGKVSEVLRNFLKGVFVDFGSAKNALELYP